MTLVRAENTNPGARQRAQPRQSAATINAGAILPPSCKHIIIPNPLPSLKDSMGKTYGHLWLF